MGQNKKYYYVTPFVKRGDSFGFLNFNLVTGELSLGSYKNTTYCQTQFTDQEIEDVLEIVNSGEITKFVKTLEREEVAYAE